MSDLVLWKEPINVINKKKKKKSTQREYLFFFNIKTINQREFQLQSPKGDVKKFPHRRQYSYS